ncbi:MULTISPECIES: DUF3825 domain-containing protein [unclassified Nodularia (in: cyanobacteria)]|uniref:DUF3825 domain-containing protein n=1 Tax=unclassified Nodularia (in: cyanobacteria) TaxID=2656917 RepID=UPI001881FE2C|nr:MULTISPECIES: DUF3825 domain-containing protein [unclassified Nodularia (in: cyanobacteria)]MBE9199515.1 DUF3825 domain-containing protein [Nodularia sp. LEGE 06071]MCC2691328.1 DUF3825 domain-containing protein [Nodularia sp. LEGE 04288]
MSQEDIRNIIIQAAQKCQTKDGWFYLSDFGSLLRDEFDFKSTGYFKLSHFLGDYADLLELKHDDSSEVPVAMGRLIEESPQLKKNGMATKPKPQVKLKNKQNSSPKAALFEWAWLGDMKKTLNKLGELALYEQWFYGDKPEFERDKYRILDNYLFYTFYRLTQEKDKIITTEEFATFNTGLVDKYYEPIFALFKKSKSRRQEWEFSDFCIEGQDWAGKTLVRQFTKMPEQANYFSNTADMLYNISAGEPKLDYQHIIVDNTIRLPLNFLEQNLPQNFSLEDITKMDYQSKYSYFKRFGKALEEDTRAFRAIKDRLDAALRLAIKRVKWNYKTAIPMYFPTRNIMSLLLPLALIDDNKVDVSLVTEQTESGSYLGHTILPLDWAYSNARLVCRPDSDWLIAQNIVQDDGEDD